MCTEQVVNAFWRSRAALWVQFNKYIEDLTLESGTSLYSDLRRTLWTTCCKVQDKVLSSFPDRGQWERWSTSLISMEFFIFGGMNLKWALSVWSAYPSSHQSTLEHSREGVVAVVVLRLMVTLRSGLGFIFSYSSVNIKWRPVLLNPVCKSGRFVQLKGIKIFPSLAKSKVHSVVMKYGTIMYIDDGKNWLLQTYWCFLFIKK